MSAGELRADVPPNWRRKEIIREIKKIQPVAGKNFKDVQVPSRLYELARALAEEEAVESRFTKVDVYWLLLNHLDRLQKQDSTATCDAILDGWKTASKALFRYALNLVLAPKRPEFKKLKFSSSFYVYNISNHLQETESVFISMGYQKASTSGGQDLVYEGDVKSSLVLESATDLLVMHEEVGLIQEQVRGQIAQLQNVILERQRHYTPNDGPVYDNISAQPGFSKGGGQSSRLEHSSPAQIPKLYPKQQHVQQPHSQGQGMQYYSPEYQQEQQAVQHQRQQYRFKEQQALHEETHSKYHLLQTSPTPNHGHLQQRVVCDGLSQPGLHQGTLPLPHTQSAPSQCKYPLSNSSQNSYTTPNDAQLNRRGVLAEYRKNNVQMENFSQQEHGVNDFSSSGSRNMDQRQQEHTVYQNYPVSQEDRISQQNPVYDNLNFLSKTADPQQQTHYKATEYSRQEPVHDSSGSRNTDPKQQADYTFDGEEIYENCTAKRIQSHAYEASSPEKISQAKSQATFKSSHYSQEVTPTSFDMSQLPLPMVEKIDPHEHSPDHSSGPLDSLVVNARSSEDGLYLPPSENQPLAMTNTNSEDPVFQDKPGSTGSDSSHEPHVSEYSTPSPAPFATTETKSTRNVPSTDINELPDVVLPAAGYSSDAMSLQQESQNVRPLLAEQQYGTVPRPKPRVPRKQPPPKSHSVDILKDNEGSEVRGLTTSQSGSNLLKPSHSPRAQPQSPFPWNLDQNNTQSSDSVKNRATVTHGRDFQQRDNNIIVAMHQGGTLMGQQSPGLEMNVTSETTPPIPTKRKNLSPQVDDQQNKPSVPHDLEAAKSPGSTQPEPAVRGIAPKCIMKRSPQLQTNAQRTEANQSEPAVRGVPSAETTVKRNAPDAQKEGPFISHAHEESKFSSNTQSAPAVKEVPSVVIDKDVPISSTAPCIPATASTRVNKPLLGPKFEPFPSESSESNLDKSGLSRAPCSPSLKAAVDSTRASSAPVSLCKSEVLASTTSAHKNVVPTLESSESHLDQDRTRLDQNHEEDGSQQHRQWSNAMISSPSGKSSKCEGNDRDSKGFEDTTAELEKKYDINLSETWTCSYCINLVPISSKNCDICGRQIEYN